VDILQIDKAWAILGKDSKIIINHVIKYPFNDRVRVMDGILIQARKIAKALSAKNHPDVSNDVDAELRFKEIQLAIRSIEYHTERFKEKARSVLLEKENSPSRTVIVIL
jgi:hypothetical protein